ncbi:MAG: hypothetical protein ACTH3E_03520 [Psychroflexus halocasei]
MENKILNSILKYCSPKVLYIINKHKRLDKRICPFKIKAITNVGEIKKDDTLMVESIKVTKDLMTVYVIDGKAYYYYHFEIL